MFGDDGSEFFEAIRGDSGESDEELLARLCGVPFSSLQSPQLINPEVQTQQTDDDDSQDDPEQCVDSSVFVPFTRTEVVVVDSRVEQADALIASLQAASNPGEVIDWFVIRLQSDQDGVLQISDQLSQITNVDAVHLISHGDGTGLLLGSTHLSLDSAGGYSADIARWGVTLQADADILIYGCELASTEDGRALVDAIAMLTGADVAASDNATGHSDLGGDWQFEYVVGSIETQVAVSDDFQSQWTYTLDAALVVDEQDDDSVIVDPSIDETEFQRIELVFIDTGVADFEAILADLQSRSGTTVLLEVALIDSDADGLAQINDYLSQVGQPLDAIHFITHGTDRAFKFGSTWFDTATANNRQAEFEQWSGSLKSGGDLLFYGCDLASTQAGRDLLESLADWTGLDIAASETSIGAESLGGNWLLEYQIGEIETQIVVSAALQAEWEGLLDTFTVTNTSNTGAGSLRQAILDANALAGHDTIQFAIGATGSFQTIGITSTLTITDSVTINGRSQGGAAYQGQPLIHVFRSSGTVNAGFHVQANDVTFTGIGVGGFSQDGILVENVSNFTLTNSSIGVNPSTFTGNANSRDGVRLTNVTNSMIGGTSFADRNIIALNGQRGVNILGTSNNIAVLGNLFQGNTTLDLDLGGNGITFNDNLDGDTGPNGLQNFPVLSTAESSPNGTRLAGNFNSNANTTYRIEVFGTIMGSQHGSGYGGGRTFLGSFEVTTDAMGNANYDTTVQGWVNAGDRVTATATVVLGAGQFGSTSEFSQQVTATSSGVVVVNTNANTSDGTTTSITNLQANRGADNPISLREAILAANNTANSGGVPDLIAFDILSWGGVSLSVTGSNLASITDAVRLDASTQRGYDGTPLISLVNGDTRSVGFNLLAGSSGSTVRGFNIQGFSTAGINIVSNSNTIAGNWIGTDAVGTGDAGNLDGIVIFEGDNNIIGGTGTHDRNVISGNIDDGIYLSGGANNTQILGNYLGLNAQGTAALGNSFSGVSVFNSSGTIIGDGTVAGRNVISGNGHRGIFLSDGDNTTIRGNYIGTNAAGDADMNGTTADGLQSGIVVRDGSTNVTIGGYLAGQGNVISGNNWYGVEFIGAGTSNNLMVGNIVGLNAAGTAALGNSQGGVSFFQGASNNTLGGGQAGARNIVSGNLNTGVHIGNTNLTGNKVQGNYIGLGADGSTVFGNQSHGVFIHTGATNNIIGTDNDGSNDATERNVISGNVNGIIINGAGVSGNIVAGNYIGTDATGTLARGNTIDGIRIEAGASNNTIGGTNVNQRNVISGNSARGIVIQGTGTNSNLVLGNYIGTNGAGTTAIANGGSGIAVWSGAQSNTIGGSAVGAGNLISGNGNDGITIADTGTNGTIVQGNLIGVNATATAKLGNAAQGIWIGGGAQSTVIGGAGAGAGNIIGGNTFAGIELHGGSTSGNFVYGNFIGTNTTGTLNLGNSGDGILVTAGANNNSIGGTIAGAGNTIAFNGRDGVRIESSAGSGNAILGNRIYSNAGLGINLVGGNENAFGVTANDLGDADTGPNGLQNFPIVSSATIDGTNVTVAGSLNSIADRTFRIEVFGNTDPDASGYGQGQRYLGAFNVTTDGFGNVIFDETLEGVTLEAGEYVAYTATDLTTNNTSEFSYAVMAVLLVNTAPSALKTTGTTEGGLALNTNDPLGDAYLVADDGGAIFGGRTALTVEIQAVFGPLSAGSDTLIEYQLANGTDEFRLTRVNLNNALWLTLNGTEIQITGFDFSTLHDGQPHSLAVSWNSTGGAWSVYVDGDVVASGTGLKSGHTLLSGGELVIGQQQNSGGGFDANRGWQATLKDLRIFSDVRTANEIAASYRSDLPYNEQGMVANWRFNDLSAAGVTTDSVAGNNLTLANTGEASHVAGTASLTFRLDENSNAGSEVGTVYGFDLEREARITQLLAADPDLRYNAETGSFYKLVDSNISWTTALSAAQANALAGVSGNLVTIETAAENAFVWGMAAEFGADVWIGASDQLVEGTWRWYVDGSAADLFWSGSIDGYRVNDAFVNWDPAEPNADDFGRLVHTTGQWRDTSGASSNSYIVEWNADDVLDATNALTYSLTSQTVGGAFTIDASTGVITVADGSLLDYETHTSHTLTIRVHDGEHWYDQNFTVSLIDQAIEPSHNLPVSQTTDEDTPLVFSSVNGNAITVTDQNGSTNSLLQVSLSVPNGMLTLSQTTGVTFVDGANGTGGFVINGTESDINAALNGLTFTPANNFNGNVNLQISTSLGADLAGHYEFSGNANDSSIGIVQNGTFLGNATTISDQVRGDVLALDGSGAHMEIDGLFGQPQNVTLAAWINLNQTTNGAEVISLGDSILLRADLSGGGLIASIYNGSNWDRIESGRFLAGTGWNHVALTFDDLNNAQSLYINGQIVGTGSLTNSIVYGLGNNTTVGRHANGGNFHHFNGLIDDARIYDRALSADEIAALATDQTSVTGNVAIEVAAVNDAPTFAAGTGFLTTAIPGSTSSQLNSTLVMPDGKIVAVGWATIDGTRDSVLVRYNVDGTLDTSFGTDGIVITNVLPGALDQANDVILLSDGKLLVTGQAGNADIFLAKYNQDGSLDTSFGSGAGFALSGISGSDAGVQVVELSDGKLLVAGDNGSADFLVARFNADGTLDTSFGSSGRITTDFAGGVDAAKGLVVQPDGKFVVTGHAWSGTSWDIALARYHADGTLDTSFGSGGRVLTDVGSDTNDRGTAIAIQDDGKLVVAGWGDASGTTDYYVLRYNTDGTLDTTFGGGSGYTITGIGTAGTQSDFALALALQLDGRIVLAGYSSNEGNNFAAVRYNSDGSLDTSFGTGGIADHDFSGSSDDRANAVAIGPDGKIVLAGWTNWDGTQAAVMRLNADGSLDSRFNLSDTLGGSISYTEKEAPVVLDDNVVIYDADLSAVDNFAGASLTLARNGGANGQDLFSATGMLGTLVEGGSLVFNGTTIGTVTTNSGGTLVVTFNANATNTLVNSAMRAIGYANSSDDPPAEVQIDWTFDDGNTGDQGSGGALTAIGSTTVNITAVNDAPEKADIEPTPLAYTEKDGPVAITSTITVNDVDNTHLTSASIQITGNYLASEDALAFTNQNGITGAWDAITGTLTLSGSATLADYQAALRSITYENSSLDPSTATRTVTFQVNDGELDSAPLTREITITAVNDAPVITVDGGDSDNASLVETNAGLFVQGTLSVNDPDSADIVNGDVSGLVVSGISTGMISSHAELLAMLTVTETVIVAGDTPRIVDLVIRLRQRSV